MSALAKRGTDAPDRSARLAELIARTALADQAAFRELYGATSSQLYGVAVRILRDGPAAEEILQESFVAVWHHAGTYVAARSQPLTWLTAIVRNRCLDTLRRRELDTVSMTADDDEPDLDLPSDSATPAELLISGAEAQCDRLFGQHGLPPEHRGRSVLRG